MPNPEVPVIEAWVQALSEVVGKLDQDTYFVGHSIGCQTILRYAEKHPTELMGGAVFVAGWFNLVGLDAEEDPEIAKPWIETPLDFMVVRKVLGTSIAILSDNDPYVELEPNKSIFEGKLGTKVVIENGKGHLSAEDGITELPSILDAILELSV